MLSKTTGKTRQIDLTVWVNYLFMAVVVLLILPPIWAGADTLPEYYYRILASLGIIDATLTIVAVAMHKLYMNKHPEEKSQLIAAEIQLDANGKPVAVAAHKRRFHPLVWIVIIYIVAQVVMSLGAMLMWGLSSNT
jgi:hypothetical protein